MSHRLWSSSQSIIISSLTSILCIIESHWVLLFCSRDTLTHNHPFPNVVNVLAPNDSHFHSVPAGDAGSYGAALTLKVYMQQHMWSYNQRLHMVLDTRRDM